MSEADEPLKMEMWAWLKPGHLFRKGGCGEGGARACLRRESQNKWGCELSPTYPFSGAF